MNNQVSEILKELIQENGIDLCNNKIKLQGLLFDLCGESKKEINILIIVMQQKITQEIISIEGETIDELTYKQLVNKVCEKVGTELKPTIWAVKCWIEVLGKKLTKSHSFNKITVQNPINSNIPIYLERLYICSLNEYILKKYSFESMFQYVARIENMKCVAFGKAKLVNRDYDIQSVIFTLEVKWDKWLEDRGIIDENWRLSITVDKTIAMGLYDYEKEFNLNGKLKIVEGLIKIKEASIDILEKDFYVNFNEEKKLDDKEILIKKIGEWTYYSSETDGYKIYKINLDGTSKILVSEDRSLSINCIDDWLFYCNGSDFYKIYKIKVDGSQKSIVSEDVTANLRLKGEWIYYNNYSDNRKTYKIRIDGSGKTMVNKNEEVEL